MKFWLFNCSKVSQLVSQAMDTKTSPARRIGIKFHLMMCKYCARYERQLQLLRKTISANTSLDGDIPHTCLDEKKKQEINDLLNNHNKVD